MIPSDLAVRLRSLIDASVQPMSVAHAISSDLPRFETGSRFTAQIQNPLPDGSFRAVVEGKTMTLALPDSAKSGDVLELIVTEQRGSTIHARQTNTLPLPAMNAGEVPKPVLSQTGQLISQLLTGRFGEPEPVPLAKGATLLPAPPQTAAELVPLLKQAVSSSGLFYESHLRQWVEGKLPLATLQQEPQAQQPPLPDPAAPPLSSRTALESSGRAPLDANGKPLSKLSVESEAAKVMLTPASSADDAAEPAQARAVHLEAFAEQAGKSSAAKAVAEPLMPIVQQQLEALASHQMTWQGQVWPGMQMQWDVSDPDHQRTSGDEELPQIWRSTLRLQLPRLGDVQAQLVFGPQGLSVQIDTDNGVSAQRMRVAQAQLQSSLEAAGVPIIQLQVSEHASA
ncbi:hypothetical protein GCM10027046_10410 [Uliginosibacterium flavum]|uniref:Flagellar hook-length control protein FliK n=1 Tax=Uliginosibacterium flavum TaxID=1396831 RepID=A0ABV2TNT6_9RHOO